MEEFSDKLNIYLSESRTNEEINHMIHDIFKNTPWIQNTTQTGTKGDMTAFEFHLQESCPAYKTIVLQQFLNYMYTFDTIGMPYSQEVVSWYREQSWDIANFSHEGET